MTTTDAAKRTNTDVKELDTNKNTEIIYYDTL